MEFDKKLVKTVNQKTNYKAKKPKKKKKKKFDLKIIGGPKHSDILQV